MYMWSNVISMDKCYKRELGYIQNELAKIKELSYAKEESQNRAWIYLACACQTRDEVEERVNSVIETVYLAFLKTEYFKKRIPLVNFNHAKCALLSSIVCFDNDFESGIIQKTLASMLDLSVDGIYNFRLKSLQDAWSEVAEVATRLLENSVCDEDVFDVASFIAGSDGGRNDIVVDSDCASGMTVKNLTEQTVVSPLNLYDDKEYDAMFAIIREKPRQIVVKGEPFSRAMMNCLGKIANVVQTA